jgi:hypothetical protein
VTLLELLLLLLLLMMMMIERVVLIVLHLVAVVQGHVLQRAVYGQCGHQAARSGTGGH